MRQLVLAALLVVAAALCEPSQAQQQRRLLLQQQQLRRGRRHSDTAPPSPELQAALDSSIRAYERGQQQRIQAAAAVPFAVTIPTYFHVITDADGKLPDGGAGAVNVSDDVLTAQMRVLNTAFAGSGFSFELRDVSRTVNAAWFSFYDMASPTELEMKQALRKGGVDALNVYVTWGQDRIGSWSYAPLTNMTAPGFEASDLFARDGVVMAACFLPDLLNAYLLDYAYLINGTTTTSSAAANSSSSSSPGGGNSTDGEDYYSAAYEEEASLEALLYYSMGISLVHEVGHFLGLYDAFDLTGRCLDGPSKGDRVADTPAAALPSYACTPQDSCPQKKGSDPVHNYMNLSPDICSYEFTPGQLARLQAVWKVTRGRPAARKKKSARGRRLLLAQEGWLQGRQRRT